MIRSILKILLLFLLLIIMSCATATNSMPKFEKLEKTTILVNGKIDYNKNKEYFPRTISTAESKNSSLIIKYQYDLNYGKENGIEQLNFFNPLLIAGFPIGQDTLVVVGKLDIINQGKIIKSYSAAFTSEKTRNLFYQGPTFSELRMMGLINIRDNIESQMYNDREFLLKLNGNDFSESTILGGMK